MKKPLIDYIVMLTDDTTNGNVEWRKFPEEDNIQTLAFYAFYYELTIALSEEVCIITRMVNDEYQMKQFVKSNLSDDEQAAWVVLYDVVKLKAVED